MYSTAQGGCTVIIPVRPGCERSIRDFLRGLQAELATVTGLHFMSLFVIPAVDGSRCELVIEANYDGSLDGFAVGLWKQERKMVQGILRHCGGPVPATAKEFTRRLRKHNRGTEP